MIKNAVGLVCLVALSISSAEAENARAQTTVEYEVGELFAKKQFKPHFATALGLDGGKQSPIVFDNQQQSAQLKLTKLITPSDQKHVRHTQEPNERHAKLLFKANALFKQQEYKSAYQILEPLEEDLAGDLTYDKLLSQVALASGNPTNAILALERVTAINPDDINIRSLLAQAYFQLGELEASKSEFETVLKHSQSKQDAKAIDQFITAIDKRLEGGDQFNAYFQTGLGWDSNVNSATNDPTTAYAIPGLTLGDLQRTAGEVSSRFMQLSGGLSFAVPATENVAYIGHLKLNKTLNKRFKEFEVASIDINAGIQYKYGKEALSFTLQNNHFYVDEDYFREAYGAMAQWQHTLSPQSQVSLYGQYAKLAFEDFDSRDADRYVLGMNAVHAFQASYSPIAFGGVYLAQEDADADVWSQDIYGVRAGGQLTFTPKWVAYATIGYERREYQDISILSQAYREDDQYDVSFGVNYMPAPLWTIKPKISYIKNDSNDLIYEYNRSVVTVNVQRDFNW